MSAILVKADKESNDILARLARKLGADVIKIDESQYEDILLGAIMDKEKTGKTVPKEEIMKKLAGK